MNVAVAVCDLCGLACGRNPVTGRFEGVERAFCCAGCLHVYSILLEGGILAEGGDFRRSEIYQRSLKLGLISNPSAEPPRIPPGAATREALYHVGGLWCSSCGWLIEHALEREYGVASAEVLFTSDLLKVRYCPQYLAPGRIQERVESLGYRASEFGSERDQESAERKDLLLRLGLAAFLWMNVMLFSLVIYTSYFERIAESARRGVPFILMGLAAPAVFYSAWPVLRIAGRGLRERVVRMEALVALGVLAAFAYSSIQAFRGGQHYYFDTACAIVTLVLLGKTMERSAKARTAQAVTLRYRMMPKKARRFGDSREKFVSIEAIEPGMTLLVKPGERIPCDGVVLEGNSSVDESMVTGESVPRPKFAGSELIGGSINGSGTLVMGVTRAGAESTLARIIRAVESALASRTPLERAVDRVARFFVPAVMLAAAATLAGWMLAGAGIETALLRAIAVVVIACPCALGIATPLATTAAVGAASRRGILIRDARVLETISKLDVVILDKTGTVTEGDFKVQAVAPAGAEEALSLLASVEAWSEHPVAQAVVRMARDRGLDPQPARDVAVRPGAGIAGWVGGRRVIAGSRRMLEAGRPAIPPDLDDQARAWESGGRTVVFCAIDGTVAAVLALGDELREDAARFVARMKRGGLRTVLLSGDSPETTARIGARLGTDDSFGGVLPEHKAGAVRRYQQDGSVVAMVGDGVNDAPALAAADLGIAMGSGTDLAMEAAPVVLMSGSLARIGETFDIARVTFRVVRQNLFWAFLYNTAGISLAILGILNPILAAAAMVLSSLSVIGNSLRVSRDVGRRSAPSSETPFHRLPGQ
jgi:heavy metal translocating P-type ATPase